MSATSAGLEPRQASLPLIRGRRGHLCNDRAALRDEASLYAGRKRSHFTVQARRRGCEEAVLSRKGTLQRRRPLTWTEKSGPEPCQASSTESKREVRSKDDL